MFVAFKKCPPIWFLNPSDSTLNSGDAVRQKLQEMKEMEGVLFGYVESKNEFIPADLRYKDCKIGDYKYIIASSLD